MSWDLELPSWKTNQDIGLGNPTVGSHLESGSWWVLHMLTLRGAFVL